MMGFSNARARSEHLFPRGGGTRAHALLCRTWVKGRDWCDLGWYTSRKVTPDLEPLHHALLQQGTAAADRGSASLAESGARVYSRGVQGKASAPTREAQSRDRLFWVIYYLPWVTVLIRVSLNIVPEFGLNPVTAALLGSFLVLAVCQPFIVARYPTLTQPCLVLQTLLIGALIFTPPLRDYYALLILSVSLVATRHLRGNQDVAWLAVCCVAPSVALLAAFGANEGIQYVPTYAAGVLCLGLYGRASRRAEEARRRSEELLAKLRAYAEQAEELATAQELHDAVTQTIFGVTLTAQAAGIAAEQDPARVPSLLERIQESSADALAELRAMVAELRPIRVAEDGLVSTLRRHLALRERREKLAVRFSVTGDEHGEPGAHEALFRTIQEALNNVAKHAGVTDVMVSLAFAADGIEATIRDAGNGFDPAALSGGQGFGLTTMRERIESAGGTFTLTSKKGEGTEIVARVPISPGGQTHGEEPEDTSPDRR